MATAKNAFKNRYWNFQKKRMKLKKKIHEVKAKVFEKIFLDLQQDEIELANPNFKALYHVLLEQFQTKGEILLEHIMPTIEPELSSLVSTILMDQEKYPPPVGEKKYFCERSRSASRFNGHRNNSELAKTLGK